MKKDMCNRRIPYPVEGEIDLKVLEKRYDCYKKYMSFAGITYDRQYCDYTTKDADTLYACLDKFKIDKKADYCIHKDPYKALRYLGGSDEYQDCMKEEHEDISDATGCNQKLMWA